MNHLRVGKSSTKCLTDVKIKNGSKLSVLMIRDDPKEKYLQNDFGEKFLPLKHFNQMNESS